MTFIRTGMNLSLSFLNWFPRITQPKNQLTKKYKTHDYSHLERGSNYFFESLKEDMQGCMTGFGKGIKPGDYIILQQGSEPARYQVEEIDYYSDPPDMWMALLKQVPIIFGL